MTAIEFALRGRAKEPERALERACLARFGTLRVHGLTKLVRSDNGLIFQSRRFALPAATTVCAKSSSHLVHPSKTASSNASFAASRKNAFGSTTSAASLKPEPPFLSGLDRTRPNGPPTRPSAIAARDSFRGTTSTRGLKSREHYMAAQNLSRRQLHLILAGRSSSAAIYSIDTQRVTLYNAIK